MRLLSVCSSFSSNAFLNWASLSMYESITESKFCLFCMKIGTHMSELLLANLAVEANPPEAKSKMFFSFFSLSSTVKASANDMTCDR